MDIASQLEKLHQLHESKAISDEEFAKAKQAVLVGATSGLTSENDKKQLSISAHLLHRASTRPGTHAQEEAKLHGAADAIPTKQAAAQAYGPVAPKVAQLEPHEQHLHTFRITPYEYKKASLFPPRIAGWYPDCTLFVWHLTNKRLLIEPYEIGKTEGMVMKYLLTLGQANLGAKIAGMAMRQDWESGQEQLKKMDGQWLAITYTDIAKVEQQELPRYQQIGAKLARVVFKNQDVQPLVLGVAAGDAGLFSVNWYGGAFIEVFTRLLAASRETQAEAA